MFLWSRKIGLFLCFCNISFVFFLQQMQIRNHKMAGSQETLEYLIKFLAYFSSIKFYSTQVGISIKNILNLILNSINICDFQVEKEKMGKPPIHFKESQV